MHVVMPSRIVAGEDSVTEPVNAVVVSTVAPLMFSRTLL